MTTATHVATTYQIDVTHSEVAFQVRHLLSKVRGKFRTFSGTFTFDPANVAASKASVVIDATSVDTNVGDRDKHLRSDDFFAAEKFPTLTFEGTQVTPKSDGAFDLAGKLTIRGVTKDVVLSTEFLGSAKDPWGNDKVAFEAELTLNRKDYGLHWNAALETGGFLVGDEVKVTLAIQAVAVAVK